MKQNQQEQAQTLYFQTEMTKTAIAEVLGINRRTLSTWVNENNWERTRTSARHMPSLIAENMYIALAHLTNSIVSDDRLNKPITEAEGKIIHRLVLDINKLKNRATLNENLEMMRYFMEFVQSKDPKAVETIQPFVNGYIKSRAKTQPGQFMPPGFNDYGFKPKEEENVEEIQRDIFERMTPEDFPNPYEQEKETPINIAGQGFIPNAEPSPILTYNEELTADEIPDLTEESEGSEKEPHEIFPKNLLTKKQSPLNRAARRKQARTHEKKNKSHA